MQKHATSWIRRIIRFLVYLILLALVCITLAFAFVQTASGRRVVANAVTRLLSDIPYLQADIQGISGLLPFHARIETFALRDEDGLWLEANGTSAHFSVTDLFRGKVLLPGVSADAPDRRELCVFLQAK